MGVVDLSDTFCVSTSVHAPISGDSHGRAPPWAAVLSETDQRVLLPWTEGGDGGEGRRN